MKRLRRRTIIIAIVWSNSKNALLALGLALKWQDSLSKCIQTLGRIANLFPTLVFLVIGAKDLVEEYKKSTKVGFRDPRVPGVGFGDTPRITVPGTTVFAIYTIVLSPRSSYGDFIRRLKPCKTLVIYSEESRNFFFLSFEAILILTNNLS
jgi:hypothetical protein